MIDNIITCILLHWHICSTFPLAKHSPTCLTTACSNHIRCIDQLPRPLCVSSSRFHFKTCSTKLRHADKAKGVCPRFFFTFDEGVLWRRRFLHIVSNASSSRLYGRLHIHTYRILSLHPYCGQKPCGDSETPYQRMNMGMFHT